MEKKGSKKKIILFIMVVIAILAILGTILFLNNAKKEEGLNSNQNTNISENKGMDADNSKKNETNPSENETTPEPKDPVDENPGNTISTPTEEQKDEILQSNPTE